MGKTKSKIVDLEICNDGSYSPKRMINKPTPRNKGMLRVLGKDEKAKYLLRNEADDFLNGIDAGLDFLDEIVPRVNRFLGLRG